MHSVLSPLYIIKLHTYFGKLGAVEMGFVGLETDGGDIDVEVIGVPETVFGGFVTGFEEVLLTGGASKKG